MKSLRSRKSLPSAPLFDGILCSHKRCQAIVTVIVRVSTIFEISPPRIKDLKNKVIYRFTIRSGSIAVANFMRILIKT